MKTIQYLLTKARHTLAHIDSAKLDAEILLAYCLNKPRSYLFAYPEEIVPNDTISIFTALIQRRALEEPVAYIIGRQEFWSLLFTVTPDVLIPRPETEHLVELLLQQLPRDQPLQIADLGTGSGCIAIALAHECPNWHITATDQSPQALAIAKQNAERLHVNNIIFTRSNWFDALSGQHFHAIVSNPPYIASDDIHLNALKYEPINALASGQSGLDDLKIIIQQAPNYLFPDGILAVEQGYDQGNAVRELFVQAGFSQIKTFQDFAALDRVTFGFK